MPQIRITVPTDAELGIAPDAPEDSREYAVFNWLKNEAGVFHASVKSCRQAKPFWDFKPGDPRTVIINQP